MPADDVTMLKKLSLPKIRKLGFKYQLIAPSIIILLIIGLFPLVYTLVVSFQGITMMDNDTSFHGIKNYVAIADDTRFWGALFHTVMFTVIALPIELFLGLFMAQLFIEKLPGRQIFIALLVLPVVVAPIVSGATWSLLLDNRFGPINQIINWFMGEELTLLWTINPTLVYPAIFLAEVWQWTPFMFLLLLAALSAVDKAQLEAAAIDGASYWMIFTKITLPSIWPVMAVAILIRGLDLFRLFDIVWALTKGGPGTMTETISTFTYVKGFQQFETSYTGAVALLIIIILSFVVIGALRKVELSR
ncbi:MAG: sugar ABC transporter permease [Burkholderiales bacterium]|jgi:multiple sugar transport system permease protein|tara:strand:+ start:465 stop:1376 length:912 start_codon:yes stop_codon:yes gene_type:complete